MVLALFLATGASAQYRNGTIDTGTMITVRTIEAINVNDSDGEVFFGVVDKDVMNRAGGVVIPKGSDVELSVKDTSNNQLVLDLDSIIVDGQRYGIQTDESTLSSERKDGLGANKRTGKFVGGGAALGAIVGAIAGGGKGAAIGAGAGAAAGAGAQVLTRGRSVRVPAESLLTFRLQQPLQTQLTDNREGRRYNKPIYDGDLNTSAAYRAGMVAGRSDVDRNLARNTRSSRWTSAQDRRDYEAGYTNGYQGTAPTANPAYSNGSIRIGTDNNISWQAPGLARVFVEADNAAPRLFAEGTSGTQAAQWIEPGHLYVFILRDLNGREIARDRLDLRRSESNSRRNR